MLGFEVRLLGPMMVVAVPLEVFAEGRAVHGGYVGDHYVRTGAGRRDGGETITWVKKV